MRSATTERNRWHARGVPPALTSREVSTGGEADCKTLCAAYGAAVPEVVDQIVTDSPADPRFSDDFAGFAAEGDARVAVSALAGAPVRAGIPDAASLSAGRF